MSATTTSNGGSLIDGSRQLLELSHRPSASSPAASAEGSFVERGRDDDDVVLLADSTGPPSAGSNGEAVLVVVAVMDSTSSDDGAAGLLALVAVDSTSSDDGKVVADSATVTRAPSDSDDDGSSTVLDLAHAF